MLVKDLTKEELKILIKETMEETQLQPVIKPFLTPDEMLNLAKEVYADFSSEDIKEIESIALTRFTI